MCVSAHEKRRLNSWYTHWWGAFFPEGGYRRETRLKSQKVETFPSQTQSDTQFRVGELKSKPTCNFFSAARLNFRAIKCQPEVGGGWEQEFPLFALLQLVKLEAGRVLW